MDRIIKFRGLNSNNEWVYGDLTHDAPNSTAYYSEYSQRIHWINEKWHQCNQPVKNGTVGQFINKLDKNNNEIYEDNIITHPLCVKEPHNADEPCEHFVGIIQFEVDRGQYFAVNGKSNGYVIVMSEAYKFEIIGDKFHNPELIKE
jgi:hypothetical protein